MFNLKVDTEIKLGFIYPEKPVKETVKVLSVKDFRHYIGNYIHGPEHNAYYDLEDILKVCLNVMNESRRYTRLS